MNPFKGVLPKGKGPKGTCLETKPIPVEAIKRRFRLATEVFGDKCFYCGEKATSTDHLIPRHLGGSHNQKNLVPACFQCNQDKGNRLPTNNEMAKHREGWRIFNQRNLT